MSDGIAAISRPFSLEIVIPKVRPAPELSGPVVPVTSLQPKVAPGFTLTVTADTIRLPDPPTGQPLTITVSWKIDPSERVTTNDFIAVVSVGPRVPGFRTPYQFFPFGLVAVIFGHVHGRSVAEEREAFYQQLDAALGAPPAQAVSPAPSLDAVPQPSSP